MTTDEKPVAVVKYVDMPLKMQQDAVDTCYEGMENFTEEFEMASYLKKEFDRKYKPNWQCIVGKSYGSFISHEENGFIFFNMNGYAVMLFKAGF
ncbi:unnamed protein product [Heterobilharzia americana]|nr:unnamed protein product [Heterobilharzia americana]CAH8461742.1 unnamed protein product [Heterobilharzia americana]